MPSTVVAQFKYDPVQLILTVEFVSGLVYEYMGVPENVYRELRVSSSKGTYLNKYIKRNYEYKKINAAQ
jgi:hypothetical protein